MTDRKDTEMPIDKDYASRVDGVAELPAPFRTALEGRTLPSEVVRLLIHGPAFTTPVAGYPATVLAVTDRRWLVAEDGDGRVTVDECEYADTLLLELTVVLLHGQLKIDFIRDGQAASTAVQFNTLREKEYRRAIDLILSGMEDEPIPPPARADDAPRADDRLMADWPYKFHNLCPTYLPLGRQMRAAAHWPTVYGGFNRELAPAAALLLTERELVVFSEERSHLWLRRREEQKLGEVITYFPLSRLARFRTSRHDRLGVLSLEAHAHYGGEVLEVLFAPEQTQAVTRLLEQTTEGRAA